MAVPANRRSRSRPEVSPSKPESAAQGYDNLFIKSLNDGSAADPTVTLLMPTPDRRTPIDSACGEWTRWTSLGNGQNKHGGDLRDGSPFSECPWPSH